MDIVRSLVSGKKKRYLEDGYNLDLSYITPRLIAMSLPGEGVHKVYRNSISSVSRFLNSKHRDKYKILNLSGLSYDYSKFNNNVEDYKWQDHYPPEIDVLFRACISIDQWLSIDSENIIVTNCRAGKGRTGTLICCYMIFCGKFNNYLDAANYYKIKRFSEGGGVTQPSQLRYINYFAQIMHNNIKYPKIVSIERIITKTLPHCSGNSSKLIFTISENDKTIFSSQAKDRDKQLSLSDNWEDETIHEILNFKEKRMIQGDITCTLTHWGLIKIKKICRFTFNTAFIPESLELKFDKHELDPDNFKNSRKASEKFFVNIQFQKSCPCTAEIPFEQRCAFCNVYLKKCEKEKWDEIHEIIRNRCGMDPNVLLFGNGEDVDVGAVLNSVAEDVDLSSNSSGN